MNELDNFFNICGPRIARKSFNFPHAMQKTYYFKDDEAYTEDHILVKKLYIISVAAAVSSKNNSYCYYWPIYQCMALYQC